MRVKNRLTSSVGETIGETLVALLLVVLSFMMVCGAVVTSARINARLKASEVAFQAGGAVDTDSVKVNNQNVTVQFYETENGYVYYE